MGELYTLSSISLSFLVVIGPNKKGLEGDTTSREKSVGSVVFSLIQSLISILRNVGNLPSSQCQKRYRHVF